MLSTLPGFTALVIGAAQVLPHLLFLLSSLLSSSARW